MVTSNGSSLSAALFGHARRAILGLLYTHPDQAYYLRELVRSAGLGIGVAQREVKRLSEAGILRRTVSGRQVYYQANPDCPVFDELKGLMVKTAGIAEVLVGSLAPLAARITTAFIYGSFARNSQKNSSDVDIIVVGDVTFGEVISALGDAQESLAREINPTVYSPSAFGAKLKGRDHFVKTVVGEKKIFLVGDETELTRLGTKRLGKPA
jgi:uncharacterized protein